MKKLLSILSASLLVSFVPATADTLFSEDFSNGATASSEFTTHGQGTFTFNDGNLDITTPSTFNLVRTDVDNSFVDDGTAPITYSATFGYSVDAGARVGGLAFRMDGTGAASSDTNSFFNNGVLQNGYTLQQYWDGSNTVLILNRYNDGVATVQISDLNVHPELATNGPGTLSATLTDTATAVNFAISYDGTLLTTFADTSADRVTSGEGIGAVFGNNGSDQDLSAQFTSLTATTESVPEPSVAAFLFASLVILGVIIRRKASQA